MDDERQATGRQDNAFAPAFLTLLDELDDVATAAEAEMAGPWKITATDGGYALLRVYDDVRDGRQPEAIFNDLPTALRFLAVLPSVGRPPLIEMESSLREGWHVLKSEGFPVGGLRIFNESFVHAGHVASCLTRAPLSLAALLLASGPQAIREVGRILTRVLTPAEVGRAWLALAEFPPRRTS
jgi:hypothetical protein